MVEIFTFCCNVVPFFEIFQFVSIFLFENYLWKFLLFLGISIFYRISSSYRISIFFIEILTFVCVSYQFFVEITTFCCNMFFSEIFQLFFSGNCQFLSKFFWNFQFLSNLIFYLVLSKFFLFVETFPLFCANFYLFLQNFQFFVEISCSCRISICFIEMIFTFRCNVCFFFRNFRVFLWKFSVMSKYFLDCPART